jgi:hypothetical protein
MPVSSELRYVSARTWSLDHDEIGMSLSNVEQEETGKSRLKSNKFMHLDMS